MSCDWSRWRSIQLSLGAVLAGDVGGEAVLVLEAVAAGGALHPLHRDVVGDEVLHTFHQTSAFNLNSKRNPFLLSSSPVFVYNSLPLRCLDLSLFFAQV
jgi:hypothetical protein